MKEQNNYLFFIFVTLLTVLVILSSLYSLSGYFSRISFFNIVANFSTNFVSSLAGKFEFFSDIFENIDVKLVLTTIATVIASILAIAFSVSLFNIQIISEKYTSRLLDYYAHDKEVRYLLYLSLTNLLLSILLIFTYSLLHPLVSYVILLIIIFCFTANIILFVRYFYKILRIVNPIRLADLLKDKCITDIKNQNEQDAKKIITILGDITIKSIQRKEEDVSKKNIEVLGSILDEYISLISENPSTYKITSNRIPSEKQKTTDMSSLIEHILEQYFRLFKEAIVKEDEAVVKEVVSTIFCTIHDFLFEYKKFEYTSWLFNRLFLGYIYLMCRFSIKNKSVLRGDIISSLINTLQLNQFMPEIIIKPTILIDRYVELESITKTLSDINKLVLDYDDFELFKNEVDEVAWHLGLLKEPAEIQTEIVSKLYESEMYLPTSLHLDTAFMYETDKKRTHLQFMIKKEQLKNFATAYVFENKLGTNLFEFKDFVIKGIQTLKNEKNSENISRIEELLYTTKGVGHPQKESAKDKVFDLYCNSMIYKTFFVVGGYILFCGYTGKLKEPEKYILELWTHTKQKDADASWGNRTPVTFDTLWLTNLLLYGGKNNSLWLHDYAPDTFHGVTVYAYKYYVLCITKKRTSLELPQKDYLSKLKEEKAFYELDWWYLFCNEFVLTVDKLIKYCNELIDESKTSNKWNLLFDNANAKEKFEDTKIWLEKTKRECAVLISYIETLLPLDSDKLVSCREEILKAYNESSNIGDLVELKVFDKKRDKTIQFVTLYNREALVPRGWFIKSSYGDSSSIWQSFGKVVASGERNYFIEHVLANKKIKRIKPRDNTPTEVYTLIVSTVTSLKKQGFNPSVIIMPLEIFFGFEKTLSKKIVYENALEFLKINEDTKLRIIKIPLVTHKLGNILVSDKTFGVWTYKPDEKTKEHVQIGIEEYDKDTTQVNALVTAVVNFKVINPGGIKILEVGKI